MHFPHKMLIPGELTEYILCFPDVYVYLLYNCSTCFTKHLNEGKDTEADWSFNFSGCVNNPREFHLTRGKTYHHIITARARQDHLSNLC